MSGSNIAAVVGDGEVKSFADSNINLPHDKVVEYRSRVASLRDTLAVKIAADPAYAVVRAVEAGSLAKGTALRTTSDFDLAVYLRADKVPQNDVELLPWLVDRLKEARPRLDDDQFVPKDHCVCIMYRDGREVDVVPVLDAGRNDGDGHLISKDTGARVLTNIPGQLAFIRKRKARVPIRFRQGVRLVKWWAEQHKRSDPSFRFKSYLAELLSAHLLDHGIADFTSYPDLLMAIFGYISQSGLTEPILFEDNYKSSAVPVSVSSIMTIIDPVNPKNNIVADYTERDRRAIVAAAGEALDAISDAEYTPYPSQALQDWQEVLGAQFRGSR